MLMSEYIIWRCETREEIKRRHPEWTKKTVEAYLDKLADQLGIDVNVEKDK